MARASKAVATKTTSTAIALVDQELANEVAALRNQINAPSGNKFKLDPQGFFSTPEGLELGDSIQLVVVDFITRHFYYSGPYNPSNIVPPDCYAVGKDKTTLAPGEDAPTPQSSACATCPMNVFGSGNNGKSKACQNRYWLACLLVDPENPDAHNAPDAPLYILDLSPSNLRGFDAAVGTIARSLNGPPIKGIVTATARNAGTYATVSFSDVVANPDYAHHMSRRAEAMEMLTRRPDFTAAAAARPSPRQPARRPAGNRR